MRSRISKTKLFIALLVAALLLSATGVKVKKRFSKPKWAISHVTKECFQERLKKGIPQWMHQQIARDLSAYQEKGIDISALHAVMQDDLIQRYGFLLFEVKDNHPTCKTTDEIGQGKTCFQTCAAINRLCALAPLPDVTFLISFDDIFEDRQELSQLPIFRFAKQQHQTHLILMPDFKALTGYDSLRNEVDSAALQYSWEQKKEVCFWRGSSTGGTFTFDNWKEFARSKLVLMSLEMPQLLDARYMAIAQCEKGLPKHLKELGLVDKRIPLFDHLPYKYQIDVDGNTTTYERLYWELYSNCLAFKQMTEHTQWYYCALQPYVHYVPVKNDLSDLPEKITWAMQNDNEARQIAQNATAFVKDNLMPEDTLLYVYALLQAYAPLQKTDGMPK